MTLADELERAAALAAALAGAGDVVSGVLATEPEPGQRVYLCSIDGADGTRAWVGVREDGSVVTSRADVRAAVSIAALCEVAVDTAGGGDLDGLIASLADLREREAPEGIEDAEAAAAALCATSSAIRRSSPRRRGSTRSARRRVVSSSSSTLAVRLRSRRRSRPRRARCPSSSARSRPATWSTSRNLLRMEGSGGFFPFGGGDPEDLLGALREFAEKQADSVQEAQREQFATLTLSTAVELTAAALGQMQVDGPSDAQAIALRDAMRVLFPEAVALVSAARQGFMRQS